MQPTITRQVVVEAESLRSARSLESLLSGPINADLLLAESLGGNWPARLRDMESTLEDCDLAGGSIEAVSVVLPPVEWEEAAECVGELLGFVHRRGARCLNLRFPKLYPPAPTSPIDGYQSAFNQAYRLLPDVRYDAEAAGVSVAVEVARDGFLLSPIEARELIDSANSWAIGACVDFTAIGEDARALDWLVTLRGRVRCVRTANPRSERLNDTLEAMGYGGPVVAMP